MTSLQSKIQIVLQPPLPSTCCVCGRSADGIVRFLDFQLSLDYYGAVVICESCANEMLAVLDFAPVASLQNVVHWNTKLSLENLELKQENERLRNAIDSVLILRPDLSDTVSDFTISMDSQDATEADGLFDEAELGFIKSDSEWRPEDFPKSSDESKF